MLERVGDAGTFKAKLSELTEQGFVAPQNAAVLEAALDAGSAAAHRGYNPNANDLNAVIEIIENVLQSVYHLGKVANRLKKGVPPRT